MCVVGLHARDSEVVSAVGVRFCRKMVVASVVAIIAGVAAVVYAGEKVI